MHRITIILLTLLTIMLACICSQAISDEFSDYKKQGYVFTKYAGGKVACHQATWVHLKLLKSNNYVFLVKKNNETSEVDLYGIKLDVEIVEDSMFVDKELLASNTEKDSGPTTSIHLFSECNQTLSLGIDVVANDDKDLDIEVYLGVKSQ